MVGISLGAICSGALVEYGPHPRELIFVIALGVLAVIAALLFRCPETVTTRAGLAESLRPRLAVPSGAVRPFVTACLVFLATWPIGGLYQAFAPSLVVEHLGSENVLVGSLVFASILVLNPVAAPLFRHRRPEPWIATAMALLCIAMVTLDVAVHAGSILWVIGASLAIGFAQGAASTCAMGGLLRSTTSADRAGVIATVFAVGYVSTAISVGVTGGLTQVMDLADITTLYVGFAIVAAGATVVSVLSTRQRKAAAPSLNGG